MDDRLREAAEYVRDHDGWGLAGEPDETFIYHAKLLADHLLPRQECKIKYLPGEGPETV